MPETILGVTTVGITGLPGSIGGGPPGAGPPAYAMTIINPSSPSVVTANQKTTGGALQYLAISDANSTVSPAPLTVHVYSPGSVNVEVWTHGALAVRLTGDGAGNFTGSLNLSSEPAGPIAVGIRAYNTAVGDYSYTVYLAARMILQVTGTPVVWPTPAGASGMTLLWSDEFTSLSAAATHPGSGIWPIGYAPTATDGFTWFENKPQYGSGIYGEFGNASFEHTDSVHGYNPFTIINSFLRIRSTYDPLYVDPYGFGAHWRSGQLAGAFPDGTSNIPAMNEGYYEARIMIPTADAGANTNASGGAWFSFWFLDRTAITVNTIGNLEYDVVETYGVDGTVNHFSIHSYSPVTGPNTQLYDGRPAIGQADLSWDFHRYGMLITNSTVSAYFDDVLLATLPTSMFQGGKYPDLFPMLDLAMGGGWPLNPPPAGYFDAWIDYVRFYQGPPVLATLTLSGNVFYVGDAQGTVLGSPIGLSQGSTFALTDSHSGAVQLVAGVIQVGPTAPGSAGTFTISLTETLAGATNTPKVSVISITEYLGGGLISGSITQYTTSQNVNLTTVGTSDWIEFGYPNTATSIDRKATGGSQISNLTTIDGGVLGWYQGSLFDITWSDGTTTPVLSTPEDIQVYCDANSVGPGVSLTVPAGTGTNTLSIYLGVSGSVSSSSGLLTASLSDNSARAYVDSTLTQSGSNAGLAGAYVINYHASPASPSGQTLTITWLNNTSFSQNVQIYAAALAIGPLAISGTVQSGVTLAAVGGSAPYQWYHEGEAISGATSSTYALQTTDIGMLISVQANGVMSANYGPCLGTTVRYVSQSLGSDSYDGTAPAFTSGTTGPWKTLAHVNAQTSLPAGTSVLFKRGDTWGGPNGPDGNAGNSLGIQLSPASSGAAGNPIVFDAYGTGARPILDGSYVLGLTSDWTSTGTTNVWKSTVSFPPASTNALPNNKANDVGNLIWGISVPGGTNVPTDLVDASYGVMTGGGAGGIWYNSGDGTANIGTTKGNWNFNSDSGNFYPQVYCVGNPAATLGSDLRAAIDTCIIYFNQQTNIIIQNFDLRFCAATAINTGGAGGQCSNIILRDCIVQWVGGGFIGGVDPGDARYGDGWDVEGSCSGILMERIWWHQIYDTGPGPQCGGAHQDNITVRNNVLTKCGAFFSTFFLGGTPTVNGLSIHNNTVYCTSNCWSNNPAQRPNASGRDENVYALTIDTVTTSVHQSNMYVANNIFAGISGVSPGGVGFGIVGTGWNVGGGVNASNPFAAGGPGGTGAWLDYNCWSQNPLSPAGPPAQDIALSGANYRMLDWVQGVNVAGSGTFSPALEVHGIFDMDPQFVAQTTYNYTLGTSSPCRGSGVNLHSSPPGATAIPSNAAVGVVWDFNKNPRPTSGAFSMGAFQ